MPEDATILDFYTFDYLYGYVFDMRTMKRMEFLVDRNGIIIKDRNAINDFKKKNNYE